MLKIISAVLARPALDTAGCRVKPSFGPVNSSATQPLALPAFLTMKKSQAIYLRTSNECYFKEGATPCSS